MNGINIHDFPAHLGLGAITKTQPKFRGSMEWYADYAERHKDDGAEGRLVNMHTFSEPWDMWEMHPQGSEMVLCTAGSITLYQEQIDGSVKATTLNSGEYAINEPGVWHTADVKGKATALFITAGLGTQHRSR